MAATQSRISPNRFVTVMLALATLVVMGFAPAAAAQQLFGDFEAPEGWLPPPLNPTGVQLQTR